MQYSKDTFWEELRSGRFAMMVREATIGRTVSNSAEVYNILKPIIAGHDDVEVLYGIFLDSKNHVLEIERISEGSINGSAVYPREIIKKVLAHKAAALVLAHNHPSGCTEPSIEDRAITARLAFVLQALGVPLHDHIIIGQGHHSMADNGVMRQLQDQFHKVMQGL